MCAHTFEVVRGATKRCNRTEVKFGARGKNIREQRARVTRSARAGGTFSKDQVKTFYKNVPEGLPEA
jgi:hypothetical protein